MNQAHWLIERLVEEKLAQMLKQAENERLAQQAQQESPERNFLAKQQADLSDLNMKPQNEQPKAR
jgi:hypothetical protein